MARSDFEKDLLLNYYALRLEIEGYEKGLAENVTNVLVDYLEQCEQVECDLNFAEGFNMSLAEQIAEKLEQDLPQNGLPHAGYAEGYAKGKRDQSREYVYRLSKNELGNKKIAQLLGLDEELVEQWLDELHREELFFNRTYS